MLNIRALPPLLAKKAADDLNENQNYMKDSVKLFREWIMAQPHLNGCTDDQFLVFYLRTCKYRLEIAKEKYDNFYSIRSAIPAYFKNRNINDPNIQKLLKLGTAVPLMNMEREDDPRIILFRPGAYNTNQTKIKDIFKACTLFSDIQMMEDDNIPIAGVKLIIDFSDFSASHILQFDVIFLKIFTTYVQDSLSLRVKQIHIINLSLGIETFINFAINTFLNRKNKERVKVHSNMDSLYKVVPNHLLPAEYGGNAGSISSIIDGWIEKIKFYSDILKENEKYGTDERKRCGKPKNSESLFGIDGSFRHLTVD